MKERLRVFCGGCDDACGFEVRGSCLFAPVLRALSRGATEDQLTIIEAVLEGRFDLSEDNEPGFDNTYYSVAVPKHIPCPTCGGSGEYNDDGFGNTDICPTCHGTGKEE